MKGLVTKTTELTSDATETKRIHPSEQDLAQVQEIHGVQFAESVCSSF